MLNVEIDGGSGFCGGVIRAITRAEDYLAGHDRLYSLGAIVHNEAELSRLEERGLVTVESLSEVPDSGTVLIRAHGEPPSTYEAAATHHLEVIDCSCPVVLQLQRRIREAYARLHQDGAFRMGVRGHTLCRGAHPIPPHRRVQQLYGQALPEQLQGRVRRKKIKQIH